MNRFRHALLAGLATASVPVPAVDDVELLRLSQSVMRVEAPLPQGGFSMGSGVALSADTVITNCHVTQLARAVSVVSGGVRHLAKGQIAAAGQDLCLLYVPGLEATPVPLGTAASLRVGDAVAALGFTGGVGLQRSHGQVLALHRHEGAPVIRTSTWFNSGASGGALFGDGGELVGLLTFRLRGASNHYYAAPAEWIAGLQRLARRDGFTAVSPLAGAAQAYWQLPVEQQPRFLRAASLGSARRWGQVADLANDWLRADPFDAEAWRSLSDALSHTGTTRQADAALACALALERAASLPATAAPGPAPAAGASMSKTHSSLPIPCPVG